jgi:PST family polysaccharide transporter
MSDAWGEVGDVSRTELRGIQRAAADVGVDTEQSGNPERGVVESGLSDVEPADMNAQPEFGAQIRSALGWSVGTQVALRIASFASGVITARILAPDDLGVFAVALAVMTILVALNDLGVILGIVRWKGDIGEMTPTAFTLAIGSSLLLFVGALVAAGPLASVMGSPAAEGVIRLMAVVIVIDGIVAVPMGGTVRDLRQDVMGRAEMAAIPVGIVVTVGLALAGTGAWSLAWGRVAGALTTGALLLWASPLKLRLGWDRDIARHLLSFGVPLAGTTLVEELLLNLDYFIVGAILGVEALGFYLLAFNLSNWPISIMREGIRRVSIAGFARLDDDRSRLNAQFTRAVGLLVTVALPIVLALSILAVPIIQVLYGEKWEPASTALGVLAFLGLARVTLGLFFDLLIALGRSKSTFVLQLCWLALLAPALYLVTSATDTIRGPAIAHVAVAYGLVLPAYLAVLRANGVPLRQLGRHLVKPLLAAIPMVVILVVARVLFDRALIELIVGGAGLLLYALIVLPFDQLRDWRSRRSHKSAQLSETT